MKKSKLRIGRLLLVILILLGLIFMVSRLIIQTSNQATTSTPEQPEVSQPSIYYYEEANKERYEAYKKENPELSEEEVIWQVNVQLDKEPYTDMTMISKENENNLVLLVNKHYRYQDDFIPYELASLKNGKQVTPETKEAFEKMVEDAKKEGIYSIAAASTYRSIDFQRGLYDRYVKKDGQEAADTYSSRPASSEHHTGRTIDLMGADGTLESFEKTDACPWVHQNAYKYGFILRYPKGYEKITQYQYEPWHITYIGIEAATKMHENNITTLEEYYAKYIQHQPN